MKSSLYHLTQNQLEMLSQIEEAGGEISQEQWELLNKSNEELSHKFQNYYYFIIEQEGFIKLYDDEIKRLQKRKQVKQNMIKRLKNKMIMSMEILGKQKVECEIVKISIQSGTYSCEITDKDKIPAEFIKPPEIAEPKIDRQAIISAFKNGNEIPGAEINQSKYIKFI